jgi:hypothetical protein
MKLLVQKSLKTELRLESYKVFKFMGLDRLQNCRVRLNKEFKSEG